MEDTRRTKRPYARSNSGRQGGQTSGKVKKFCQHCKDNNGKYWTHDTEECFFKTKASKAKESNSMEDLQKELNKMRSLIKSFKKKISSDSNSD